MPQKHDIGWQKRKKATEADREPRKATTPGGLARSLVDRGLAPALILDSRTFAMRIDHAN